MGLPFIVSAIIDILGAGIALYVFRYTLYNIEDLPVSSEARTPKRSEAVSESPTREISTGTQDGAVEVKG